MIISECLLGLSLVIMFIMFCKAIADTILEIYNQRIKDNEPVEDLRILDSVNVLTIGLSAVEEYTAYIEIDYQVHMNRPSVGFFATREQVSQIIEHLQKLVDK
jgi:hypothetical protein